MSNCPTCKESILSQTPSLIGNTLCNPDCPQDITCEDIIPSNCVFYSGATLSCPSGNTSVPYGVTITEALNTMYQLICQNSTSCTVSIDANDTCCGYLGDKLVAGTGVTITKNIESAKAELLALATAGIDLVKVTDELEADGVEKFMASWEVLLAEVEKAKQ